MNQLLPSVSVIIPVYDDYERLSQCLHSLTTQTYPSVNYETIVVDNGTPDTRVRDVEAQFGHVRAITETAAGSYAARNAGIDAAANSVLAFTDADCLPASNWIEMGVRALQEDPECGLIGGNIVLFAENEDALTLAETWEMLDGFPQRKYVEAFNFAATANVFTRREVVEDIGAFDADFLSGGDREWGERLAAGGYGVVYADDVCVRHPARRTLGELLGKTVRTTRGDYLRQRKHGRWTRLRRAGRLAEAIVKLATPLPRIASSFARSEGSLRTRGRYAVAQTLVTSTKEWTLAKLLVAQQISFTSLGRF